MHGTRAANYAMDEADLIVAIGARFDDRITGKLSEFAPRAKFIHIDVDPAEISKNVPAHIPIVGDAKNILARLTTEYRALERRPARGWRSGGSGSRAGAASTRCATRTPTDSEIKPAAGDRGASTRPRAATRSSPRDVGQHQMWAAQYFDFAEPAPLDQLRRPGDDGLRPARRDGRRRSGCPDQTVVCIAGDGSVQMNTQELATCAQNGIPIKVFIINNGYLGMVRQWQELFWDGRYSQVDMGKFPDFVKLAEAYGVHRHPPDGQDDARGRHQGGDRDRGPGRGRRRASPARRTRTR